MPSHPVRLYQGDPQTSKLNNVVFYAKSPSTVQGDPQTSRLNNVVFCAKSPSTVQGDPQTSNVAYVLRRVTQYGYTSRPQNE